MDWNQLKEIKAWTSLKKLPYPVTMIDEGLFRIDVGQYVFAVPYNNNLEETDGFPFVTLLLWAPTDGAAKRVQLSEIEADEDQTPMVPPFEMLSDLGKKTYGEIVKELKRRKDDFIESAQYRIASDGAFIHQVIKANDFEYYFRSLNAVKTEMPYAIIYRLQD